MEGTSLTMARATGAVGLGASRGRSFELGRLVLRMAQDFGAPVGLLDPAEGVWIIQHGASVDAYPTLAPALMKTVASGGVDPDRVALSRAGDGGPVWLLLPVPGPDGVLVAAVGFTDREGPPPVGSTRWGPACPDPALLAWGRETVGRFGGAGPRGLGEPGSVVALTPASRATADAGEGEVLARLIRRLRISDAPERFQQLACNALRATLKVQALGWVSCARADAPVISGQVGTLSPAAFQTLTPGPRPGPVHLDNAPKNPPDPDVRRLLAVSVDAQHASGWLVAVNPAGDRNFTTADADLLQPVASMIATQQANARVYSDLKELLFGVIRALTAAIDAKDPYTSGHSERVARIAVRLAEELGISPGQRSDLYLMGLLHDVGKIGVDDAVLKKAGPLTPEEYRQIQRHVEIGVQILTDLKKLGHLLPGVRHHHESLDGTGYPCGLSGDSIPMEARILAVADSFDAMSSTRPYRKRLSPMQIDEILRKGSGSQWDPNIVDALFACRMDLEAIRQKGLGDSLKEAVTGALGRS